MVQPGESVWELGFGVPYLAIALAVVSGVEVVATDTSEMVYNQYVEDVLGVLTSTKQYTHDVIVDTLDTSRMKRMKVIHDDDPDDASCIDVSG